MPTRSLGFQSFYQGQLTSAISDTDLTIPLDVLPTPSEGILVIESTVSAKREIIYYTSKTASAVVCPSGTGNGRGYDGTTAVTHLQNSAVIMAPVGKMFSSLQDGTSMSSTVALQNLTVSGTLSVGGQTPTADWSQLASAPNTVTANGNRSYSLVFNGVDYTSTIQPGTRVRTTRTVAAPTQSTSLNGTTQYYSKTTPAGLTFTDNYTVMGWVKLTSYAAGGIIARRNADTEGWSLGVSSSGQVVSLSARVASNNSSTTTAQSIPLNKWVHVAASINLSGTSVLIYIDGILAPSTTTITGTITALVQGTTALVVGAEKSAGTNPFNGKIAQAAVFSSVLSAATIQGYISQGLAGTETNLVSAYSFNNVITDLNTTNANNLTAQASAVATNADSPFAENASGTPGGTYDYGIVQSVSFSTNTTAVVQVSEGNTIPTTGGVAALYYSSAKAPYGFPATNNKWELLTLNMTDNSQASPSTTVYNLGSVRLNLPIGYWNLGYNVAFYGAITSGVPAVQAGLSTSSSAFSDLTFKSYAEGPSGNLAVSGFGTRDQNVTLSSATTYYLNTGNYSGTTPTSIYNFGSRAATQIRALPSNL